MPYEDDMEAKEKAKQEKRERECGGVWEKQGKWGPYLSAYIDTAKCAIGPDGRIQLYPEHNKYKKPGDNSPIMRFYRPKNAAPPAPPAPSREPGSDDDDMPF